MHEDESVESVSYERYGVHMNFIESAARSAACRAGVPPQDVPDFVGWVHLRLLGDGQAVLRKHRGGRPIRHYLHVVLRNLARDYVIKLWGKWRPSARARELGTTAVLLERYLNRDGCAPEQASRILRRQHAVPESPEEIDRLVGQLPPPPTPRAAYMDPQLMEETPRPPRHPDLDALPEAHRLIDALATALRKLSSRERAVVARRFFGNASLRSLAEEWKMDIRAIYSMNERALRSLREELASLRPAGGIERFAAGLHLEPTAGNWEVAWAENDSLAIVHAQSGSPGNRQEARPSWRS